MTGDLAIGMIPDVEFGHRRHGRFLFRHLLADIATAVSILADGFEPRVETLKLSEGAAKELEVLFSTK